MKSKIFRLFLQITVLQTFLALAPAFGTPSPRVELEPVFGSTADTFTLKVTVENIHQPGVSQPVFDSNEQFQIRSRGVYSQEITINDDERYELIFQFLVVPSPNLAPGKYKLPDGIIRIRGSEVTLPGPSIEISDQGNQRRAPKNDDTAGIDFTHIVNTTSPFVGQQLFYRAEMVSTRPLRFASLSPFEPSGFLRESLGEAGKQERRMGTTTRTSLGEALFPTKPGDIEIPKRDLTVHVEVPLDDRYGPGARRRRVPLGAQIDPRDPMDALQRFLQESQNPFLVQVQERTLSAPPFTLHVKPLPDPQQQGINHPLRGYTPVGEIEVSSEQSAEYIHYGESLTQTVTVSGTANLRPYELPDLVFSHPEDFKVYKDKPELEVYPTRTGVRFQKKFQISLVPQRAGKVELPSLEILWFNPQSERYETFQIERKMLTVLPDPKLSLQKQAGPQVRTQNTEQPETSAPSPKEKVPPPALDLAPQRSIPPFLFGKRKSLILSFVFSLLIPPLLYCSALFRRRRASEGYGRRQSVLQLREQVGSAKTSAEAYRALLDLIRVSCGQSRSALTAKEAGNLLQEKVQDEKTVRDGRSLLVELEQAVYMGRGDSAQPEILQSGREFAKRLERYLALGLFLLLGFGAQDASASDFRDAVNRGDAAFASGDYQGARRGYSEALQSAPEQAHLLFNLGNSYYRLGEFPQAISFYLKALLRSPRDTEVKANLLRASARLTPEAQRSLEPTLRALKSLFPFTVSELLGLLFVLWCISWFFLWRGIERRDGRNRVALGLCALLLACFSLGLFRVLHLEGRLPRLVLEDKTKVFSQPSDDGQVISLLPQGQAIQILHVSTDWARVKTEGERSGWIRMEMLSE